MGCREVFLRNLSVLSDLAVIHSLLGKTAKPQRRKDFAKLIFLFSLICLSFGIVLCNGNATKVNQALVNLKFETGPLVITLQEADVNAWAAVAIESKKRLGVEAVTVDFGPNRAIDATARVNMDEVEVSGMGVGFFKFLLSGTQTLKLSGKLVVDAGKGRFDVQSASLNDYTIPAWLAAQVLSYLSSRQGPGIDVTEDFDLPYGITDLRTSPTALTIVRDDG